MKTAAKDFKMTELGPIPKDWDVKRLGDCCSITTGHKDVNEGCENGRFPFFTCSRDVYRANCYSFDGEAILVAGNGDVGNLHYCNGKFEAYQRTYVLMNFKIDTQYLWCELGANLMERLTDGKIGTSIPYIVLGQLQDYMFALPPLPEQWKIAAALSDVDEMIAALEKLIGKKRKIKTGAMQRLLTGKTRLPGFKGAWVEKRLGDCAEVFCDGDWIESADQSDNGIRLVQTGNVGEGVFLDKADKKRFVSEATFKRLNCCEIFAGDVLVSRLPDPAGRACLLPSSSERRITAVDCTIIRFNDLLAAEYFVAFSQTAGYYKQIDEQMAGSTRQRISRKALGDVVVSCPPTLSEQKAIAKVLGDMDEEIAALEAELAKTRQLKQGMMQELLTGKVRLV